MSKQKIKELFIELPAEEQHNILQQLIQAKKKVEIRTDTINAFAGWHQKEYQQSITFEITIQPDKLIKAVLSTTFGKFTGIGINQKLAKIEAVKEANKTLN